jgi:lambda family phage minor tail protein L
MGQGQDRISQSLLELEPTTIIEFFQLYFNTVDKPNSFIAFHGGSVFQKGIFWQGIEYLPIPVETEGFEVNANGKLSRPKIKVSNKDYFVTDLLLENEDLQFAKLIRRRTFVKYLDNANFDGGNPWGLADASAEISLDTFVIGQKTAENKSFVEFELTSPLDLENFEVNNRLVMSRYCSWYYRGNGCNYNNIPLATEDGRKLNVNFDQYKQASQDKNIGEWKIGKSYVVGDTTYLENTKIIVTNPQNNNEKSFAKIWYVCNQAHTSSSSNKPDINQNFWDKDGCNKKLDGCKLRFGEGQAEFNETTIDAIEHRVDFTSRHGSLKYNNIAPNAKVTVSSSAGAAYLINDLKTGSNLNWLSERGVTGLVTLEWDTAKNITGLHIYDHTSTTNNYNNAYIRYFNSSNQVIGSGLMRTIPTNGLAPLITGVDSNLSIKKIEISGSGGSTANVGLGEIAVFEANVPYMHYGDVFSQFANPFHRRDYFHVATKVSLSNKESSEIYSVFNNIGFASGSRYSGINVYISGYNLCLDFATRRKSQSQSSGSTLRTITLPWDNDEYKPIHLICSGGSGSGLIPILATPGFIRLSCGDFSQEYTLNDQTGEYFQFKNPSYQGGIAIGESLKFGINDWRYPFFGTSGSFPSAPANQIQQQMVVYSPISFGTTAIWTGGFAENDRIEQFNLLPNYYSKVSGRSSIRSGLLGWWDMEHTGNGIIEAENNSLEKLIVTGNNIASTQKQVTIKETISSKINQPKQSIELPFGGFPGTEKYG